MRRYCIVSKLTEKSIVFVAISFLMMGGLIAGLALPPKLVLLALGLTALTFVVVFAVAVYMALTCGSVRSALVIVMVALWGLALVLAFTTIGSPATDAFAVAVAFGWCVLAMFAVNEEVNIHYARKGQ